MKSDFLWIYNNKLDVSDTLQLIIKVRHRRHFCHFVTNSWLLGAAHRPTICHCVCVCVCVCVRVEEPPRTWSSLLQVKKEFHIIIFSLIQPWISSTEVIKSNTNNRDWLLSMCGKHWLMVCQTYNFTDSWMNLSIYLSIYLSVCLFCHI